jgi:endo-1,4-beta-D-glucanase Y
MDQDEKIKTPLDIMEETLAFKADISFRDPNASFYNLGAPKNPLFLNLKPGLKPEDIFKKLSFSEVKYADLDTELQKVIENNRGWRGHPLLGQTEKLLNPNVKLFKSSYNNTIYSVEYKGKGIYSWSRIKKTDDSYEIREVGKDSDIGYVLQAFAFYEIANSQAPRAFSSFTKHDKTPILIPIGKTAAAEETREGVEQIITGLA